MEAARPYLDLTLREWLFSELSAPAAGSGGGAALACTAAAAAAVLVCAAESSRDSWAGAAGAAAQAEVLLARAAPLAQLDAEAYAATREVRQAARTRSPELRDRAVGEAFARAAQPPLEIARVAADLAHLAAEIAAHGEPGVQADASAAAALAAAAARGAAGLVAVNLTVTSDDPRVAEAERLADVAADALARIA